MTDRLSKIVSDFPKISKSSDEYIINYPATFRLWDSPIKDQQSKDTGAAHAMASAMEILEYYDTGSKEQFSTSWYNNYKLNNNDDDKNSNLEDILCMASEVGGVHKRLMPDNLNYRESKVMFENMKDLCLEEAKKYRISHFVSVKMRDIYVNYMDDMMWALYVWNTPILCELQPYSYTTNLGGSGMMITPNITKTSTHCMLCIGWTTINDDIYFVMKNSNGVLWGDNGYGYIKATDCDLIVNAYVPFDEINNEKQFNDISGRWSENFIDRAVRSGIMSGYEDGSFKPTNTITREETAVIISKLLDKMSY